MHCTCTVCSLDCTLHTAHCTLHSKYPAHTAHHAQCTWRALHNAHCALHLVHCKLHCGRIPHSPHTAHCTVLGKIDSKSVDNHLFKELRWSGIIFGKQQLQPIADLVFDLEMGSLYEECIFDPLFLTFFGSKMVPSQGPLGVQGDQMGQKTLKTALLLGAKTHKATTSCSNTVLYVTTNRSMTLST